MDIDIDKIKRQFNIIGDDNKLDLAISTAIIVASTDLPILRRCWYPRRDLSCGR